MTSNATTPNTAPNVAPRIFSDRFFELVAGRGLAGADVWVTGAVDDGATVVDDGLAGTTAARNRVGSIHALAVWLKRHTTSSLFSGTPPDTTINPSGSAASEKPSLGTSGAKVPLYAGLPGVSRFRFRDRCGVGVAGDIDDGAAFLVPPGGIGSAGGCSGTVVILFGDAFMSNISNVLLPSSPTNIAACSLLESFRPALR